MGQQPVGSVSGRAAQRIGGGHVAQGEDAWLTGDPQFRGHPHEAVVVEQLPRQPLGVRPYPPDRPQHGVGGRGGLSGAPFDGGTGELLAGEARGHDGPVPGVQFDSGVDESAPDPLPGPGVVQGQGAFAGEVQGDAFVRPGQCDVRRGADRSGTPTDDEHRCGGREAIVGALEVPVDLGGGLQARLAPEPVGDAGRDDQRVVRLGRGRAVCAGDGHRPVRQVDPGERAVDGPDGVEPPVPVERDPVVPGPVFGSADPPPEFLAAHQSRFGRYADDVGVLGEPDRGEQTAVAQSGDDYPPADHVVALRGGRGTNRDTRSMTRW